MAKRYYWLKLKDCFFQSKEIKKLRSVAGGDTFTIIYLKIQLLSIRNGGLIRFERTEDNIIEQLSLEIDESCENIKLTLAFLSTNKLIEQLSDDEYLLNRVPELIGSATDSAERMRLLRERKKNKLPIVTKMSHCDAQSSLCYTERREKKKEKREERKDFKKYSEQSTEIRLSKLLYSLMAKNNPKAKEPDFHSWAKHIDLMIRIDGRTAQEVEGAINFSQQDTFWMANILSTEKLRKQFDRLYLQAKRGNKNGANRTKITESELREFSTSIVNDDRYL
jgi:predicted phage replisome organizer